MVRFLAFGGYKSSRLGVRFLTLGGYKSLRLGVRFLTFGCYKSLPQHHPYLIVRYFSPKVCKFYIYKHFIKSVNGPDFPVILAIGG